MTTYPIELLYFFLLRHALPEFLRIPQRPGSQLMDDAQLGKRVKLVELQWLFRVAEGIKRRRFGIVLTTRVLIEVLRPTRELERPEKSG